MECEEVCERRDYKVLTQLDKVHCNGYHRLILATTEEEMRGIDLRAPEKGVTLVISTPFSCQRNADQGLLRVGRYGDPCKRLIWEQVLLVDDKEAASLQKRLYKFAQNHKPVARAKKPILFDLAQAKAVGDQLKNEADKLRNKQQPK